MIQPLGREQSRPSIIHFYRIIVSLTCPFNHKTHQSFAYAFPPELVSTKRAKSEIYNNQGAIIFSLRGKIFPSCRMVLVGLVNRRNRLVKYGNWDVEILHCVQNDVYRQRSSKLYFLDRRVVLGYKGKELKGLRTIRISAVMLSRAKHLVLRKRRFFTSFRMTIICCLSGLFE